MTHETLNGGGEDSLGFEGSVLRLHSVVEMWVDDVRRVRCGPDTRRLCAHGACRLALIAATHQRALALVHIQAITRAFLRRLVRDGAEVAVGTFLIAVARVQHADRLVRRTITRTDTLVGAETAEMLVRATRACVRCAGVILDRASRVVAHLLVHKHGLELRARAALAQLAFVRLVCQLGAHKVELPASRILRLPAAGFAYLLVRVGGDLAAPPVHGKVHLPGRKLTFDVVLHAAAQALEAERTSVLVLLATAFGIHARRQARSCIGREGHLPPQPVAELAGRWVALVKVRARVRIARTGLDLGATFAIANSICGLGASASLATATTHERAAPKS